jgi:hypothetical protein
MRKKGILRKTAWASYIMNNLNWPLFIFFKFASYYPTFKFVDLKKKYN